MAWMIGFYSIITAVFMFINPALVIFALARLELPLDWLPRIVAGVAALLGVGLMQRWNYRVKRLTLFWNVMFWTFIAASFLIASPGQTLLATAIAVATTLSSAVAYWRSWSWV